MRINGKDSEEEDISADTTVQEKHITNPTDHKLHRKIIDTCKKIAKEFGIEVRQSYTRTLKKLYQDQRFCSQAKNRKKSNKANRKVKAITGR